MIGAGTILNPLLKLVTTVAILAAVYLFIVKPTLDTTENITSSAFEGASGLQESIQESIQSSLGDSADAQEIQKQVQDAFNSSGINPQKLQRCVRRAGSDAKKIQRCLQ